MHVCKQLTQRCSPDMAPPGGSTWMILCLWQHFVTAGILGDKYSSYICLPF